jgi:hypothetical protein
MARSCTASFKWWLLTCHKHVTQVNKLLRVFQAYPKHNHNKRHSFTFLVKIIHESVTRENSCNCFHNSKDVGII